MKLLEKKVEIKKIIKKSKEVFIMGHKYLDLDALGSAIGIYEFVKKYNTNLSIIINDRRQEPAVKKVLDKISPNYKIQKSKDITKYISKDSLLIIVDTNKQMLLQDPRLVEFIDNIIVIDHHDLSDNSISKGLVIIDEESSSTCEMLVEFLEKNNVDIGKETATYLLSGIVLDTNNYIIKTTANTFLASYILVKKGADPNYVQYLLKQDIKNYIERQKVITNVRTIKKNIALSCANSKIKYRREDLAKIADTLLQFNNIEASFVIGKLENGNVGVSARSIGKINVGEILEKLEGGGDEHEAGARIENSTIKKTDEKLKVILKNL